MPRLPLLFLSALFSVMILPQDTQAQETGTGAAAGTGQTLDAVLLSIRTTLAASKDAEVITPAIDARALQAWREEAARLRDRQREHRRACAMELHGTGVTPPMNALTRCVRGDLTQEMMLLRKQLDFFENVPLRAPAAQARLRDAHAAFADAVTAITAGLDADLFHSPDLLRTALRNLHSRYREALRQQRTALQMERERTWVLAVTDRLETLEHPPGSLLPGALCLEEAAETIRNGLDARDAPAAARQLQTARERLAGCRSLLQNADQSQ